MKRRLALPAVVSALALTLSACSNEEEMADTDLAAEDEEAEVAAEALPVTDFADLQLGPKIAGPQGQEVKSRLANEVTAFADITSYVACPAGTTEDGIAIPPVENATCDPAVMPEGTVYTYVHIVYPGEDNDPDTGSGEGDDSSDVETTESFRMTMPSHGFTGVAGFSLGEAAAAIAPVGNIIITCHEDGIAWTVEEGDGGDQWGQGEPITFFWQSTLPPSGPVDAYEVFANYTAAHGPGPYPVADETVPNACAINRE